MNVEIVGTNLGTSAALIEHTRRTVRSALERFGQRIKRVIVRLSDRNGHRGGPDKRCRVDLVMHKLGSVHVEAVGFDAYAVVDEATGKLRNVANRRLERVQQRRNQPALG